MPIYASTMPQTQESVRLIYNETGMIPLTFIHSSSYEERKDERVKTCFKLFEEINNIVAVEMGIGESFDIAFYDLDSREEKHRSNHLVLKVREVFERGVETE